LEEHTILPSGLTLGITSSLVAAQHVLVDEAVLVDESFLLVQTWIRDKVPKRQVFEEGSGRDQTADSQRYDML